MRYDTGTHVNEQLKVSVASVVGTSSSAVTLHSCNEAVTACHETCYLGFLNTMDMCEKAGHFEEQCDAVREWSECEARHIPFFAGDSGPFDTVEALSLSFEP